METLRTSQGRNRSLESLKHTLSSGSGRESLRALPIEEAITVIDALERVSIKWLALLPANVKQGSREDSPLCTHHQKRFSIMLRKMCRERMWLPPSYTISDELRWIGELPYGGGGSADVWRGAYRGSRVAIKVLRVNSRVDLVSLERVRPFVCIQKLAYPDENGIEILLRSGSVEEIQTPEPATVGGGKKNLASLDDGSRVDGAWYHHGLHYRTSRDKPAKTGEPSARGLKRTLTDIALQLADVARGLKYLHDWPSVHADLKSVSQTPGAAFKCVVLTMRRATFS